jgi:DNA-binding GntR family transcriptional regulator
MEATPRGSKQELVYSTLRRRILDGSYPPGYRLVIDTISRELQVSPMPVREAIRRLEAERWIVYQRHQGAQVAPRDAESWAEAVEAVALLDGFVTAQAAPHLRPEDFARLRAIDAQMRADIEAVDILGLIERNEEFHGTIWSRCPNRILRREVEEAEQRLTARSPLYFPPSNWRQALDDHVELIAMLEDGRDFDEIEHFVRLHKLRVIEDSAQDRRSA